MKPAAPVYLHREIEPVLAERLRSFPAVALTGPRQTGKSTLLRTLLPDYTYVTLDDPFTRSQALDDPELLLNTSGERVIIDEIQYAPSLLPYIKIRIDRDRQAKGRFILTGWQQFTLIRHLGETLAGRIALLELLPFSCRELAASPRAGGGTPTAGGGTPALRSGSRAFFEAACLRGLFPEPALADWPSSELQNAWYAAYLQTYLERDIRMVYDIGNLREFDRMLRLLATRCAQPLNMSALAADVGVAVNTVKKWISILEACRIVYLLPPYYRNLGKRITKAPKVYFTDCGLVCHLTRLRDFEHVLQGPLSGPLFENLCISEALKAALHRGKQPPFYYLRTQAGLEVDLLVEGPNGRLSPFEFKLAETPRPDMAAGLARFSAEFAALDPAPGVVVSLSERTAPLGPASTLLPLRSFADSVAELA